MARHLAVFDFDGTLVAGDSLPCFIAACVGWPRTLLMALIAFVLTLGAADRRTAFKAAWLRACLSNFPAARLPDAVARLRAQLRWNDSMRARLAWHRQRGDVIAIATGGLDLYLAEVLKELNIDHLLCTQMALGDQRVIGVMRNANCVRAEKARRVAELIAHTGPYDEIWGYGNAPNDLPMLELATHRVIV